MVEFRAFAAGRRPVQAFAAAPLPLIEGERIAPPHGIGDVYALPIPLGYYLAGAAVAVALSFLLLALFLRAPGERSWRRRLATPWLPRVLRAGRWVTWGVLGLLITAGLMGEDDPNRNIAPLGLWVLVLIGYSVLAVLVGNAWEHVGPWSPRPGVAERRRELAPRAIAGTAGAVGLFALFWWELVSGWSFRPIAVGVVLAAYVGVMTILASRARGWVPAADPLGALFQLIGRISFVRIVDGGRALRVTPPSGRLHGAMAPWWTVALACVLLAGASFDHIAESVQWWDLLRLLGLDAVDSRVTGTAGLALTVAFFAATYLGAVVVLGVVVGRVGEWTRYARQFVWSVVPVAFAYALAHNFSLVVIALPVLWRLLSDPFGLGWDLIGTADFDSSELLVGARVVWLAQLALVVAGHVAGVWLAHTLALREFRHSARATLSQVPLAALMVLYTGITLWLLSLPIVE